MSRDISLFASACLLWLFGGCGGSLRAEEAPVTSAEVRALLQRLEQAESRIQVLQERLEESQTSQPRPFPEPPPPAPYDAVIPFQGGTPADSLATRVSELQRQFDEVQSGHARLLETNKDLTEQQAALQNRYDKFTADLLKGNGVVIPGAPGVTLKVGFRILADYWSFPGSDLGDSVLEGTPAMPVNPQDRLGFRRVRLTLRGDIRDNMLYKFDLEMAEPNTHQWRDAYFGFKDLPVLQTLLIGYQKRPYDLDTLNSSNDNIFLERPFVSDAVNPNYRRLGIVSYGVSEDERWNWRYGLYDAADLQAVNAFAVNDQYQIEGAGRLANTWWYDEESNGRGYAHWAVSGAVGHPDSGTPLNAARFFTRPEARSTRNWIDTGPIAGAEWYELVGLEQVFNAGPLQLVGEAHSIHVQRSSGDPLHFWGAYGYVSYFLTGEHMPWNRRTGTLDNVKPFENFFLVDRLSGGTGSGWGAWQVAARYSYLDASDGNVLGGVGHSTTLGLVWYFNPNAKMQFNWVHGWIGDAAPLQTAGVDHAQYDILGLRCLFFF